MKLVGAKNPRMKEKMKKVIKLLGKITSENPKCHLHIP
jgi:predicted DNA-binding protein with PD1-like motif